MKAIFLIGLLLVCVIRPWLIPWQWTKARVEKVDNSFRVSALSDADRYLHWIAQNSPVFVFAIRSMPSSGPGRLSCAAHFSGTSERLHTSDSFVRCSGAERRVNLVSNSNESPTAFVLGRRATAAVKSFQERHFLKTERIIRKS